MSDLNDLVRPTPLHLLFAAAINASGQIAGIAVDTRNGEVHGFLATPRDGSGQDDGPRLFSMEDVRRVLEHLRPLSRHGIRFVPGW
jgi:hypothetical protein